MLKKVKKYDLIFWVIALILAVGSVFIPKTGKTALIDSFVKLLFLWCIVIYVWIKVLKIKQDIKKVIIVYIICSAVTIFGIWESKNLITDFITGPKEITLYDATVMQYTGNKGFISLHYYLSGYDSEGNRYMIQISSDDYDIIATGKQQITITYYENIKRLYKLGGAK